MNQLDALGASLRIWESFVDAYDAVRAGEPDPERRAWMRDLRKEPPTFVHDLKQRVRIYCAEHGIEIDGDDGT